MAKVAIGARTLLYFTHSPLFLSELTLVESRTFPHMPGAGS